MLSGRRRSDCTIRLHRHRRGAAVTSRFATGRPGL